jgi:hypothetical protein
MPQVDCSSMPRRLRFYEILRTHDARPGFMIRLLCYTTSRERIA